MNRRHFLAGSIALAGQQKLLRPMGALSINGQGASAATSPQDLLATTFTESFLKTTSSQRRSTILIRGGMSARHGSQYRRICARRSCDRPRQIRRPDGAPCWAASFLEFKRNGNRSRYEAQSFGRRAGWSGLCWPSALKARVDLSMTLSMACGSSAKNHSGEPPRTSICRRPASGLYDITDPIIELFGAETGQLLAWTKYLVGAKLDEVSPLVNKRIVLEAERRLLEPARDRNDFWWMGFEEYSHGAAQQLDAMDQLEPDGCEPAA